MTALCAWLTAHKSSCLELFGFVTGVINVWLVTGQRTWAWPVGILNAAVYTVFFARTGLYSDSALQLLYVVLSAYGWWHWTRPSPPRQSASPLTIARVSAHTTQRLLLVGIVVWILLAGITSRIPGSALPWLDAALVSCSLLAQWMMTRKVLEHWVVWIVVDIVYTGMFITRGYLLTALLYAVFTILAVYGLKQWTRTPHQLRTLS